MERKVNEIYALGIGCSTFVRTELASACGYQLRGLYHYNNERTGQTDHGFLILGSFDDLFSKDLCGKNFILTMGDMKIRKTLFDKITSLGGNIPTLLHPKAEISPFASISPRGVLIDSQAIIQSDCVIGDGSLILSQSMVCHQTIIEPNVFIAPKAIIGARLKIHEFAFIGQNATIISTKVKEIGYHAVVGAGSVVTKPVLDGKVVIGNPAHEMAYGNK